MRALVQCIVMNLSRKCCIAALGINFFVFLIPDTPLRALFQVSSTLFPIAQTIPRPVITQRFLFSVISIPPLSSKESLPEDPLCDINTYNKKFPARQKLSIGQPYSCLTDIPLLLTYALLHTLQGLLHCRMAPCPHLSLIHRTPCR